MIEGELKGIENVLSYNPDDGLFRHKTSKGLARYVGRVIDSKDSHGYIRVSYKGKRYLGHRVAYYMMLGFWPKADVDHIDGVRDNNKWSNLREATRSQNLWNQKSTRGASKYKGVTVVRDKVFIAQLKRPSEGISGYIGSYTCEKEAGLAYNYKAKGKFGNFARFNQVFEDVSVGIND